MDFEHTALHQEMSVTAIYSDEMCPEVFASNLCPNLKPSPTCIGYQKHRFCTGHAMIQIAISVGSARLRVTPPTSLRASSRTQVARKAKQKWVKMISFGSLCDDYCDLVDEELKQLIWQ
eukprot:scaffold537734_cov15-Prasinocladus_malaysianus.AAC.1